MRDLILQLSKSSIYSTKPRTAGDKLVDESAVMSLAINSILQSEGHLNNKAIILWLIQALESTDDVVTADVIRKTLEIVVGYTMDDI
ncbi:biofilm development regulator YmgB/AriR family protein [Klebsiella variicola]|uniref:biofilm development regulator YmgB/AriR family protein n=1 Tax=Klebsiella variicola TaxID=244366 RepID=UPI002481BA25|nr:biofilm development regulator YmgB/AriR family protein [Klebsiella variicola]MDI0466726.1 biofilm development regulator YmgB/AriR family protein [Klebsiella variicola]